MKATKLIFSQKLPNLRRESDLLVIYDNKLSKLSPVFRQWIKAYSHTYPVQAGEKLKDIERFPLHIKKILKITHALNSKNLTIVAIGGGSISDFSGFVASVFKRGVKLVHIPSTWMSAVDSSHGGKTALNVGEAKNQIGTYYAADRTYIVRDLLKSQPQARLVEAFAELYKIALIQGGDFYKKVSRLTTLNDRTFFAHLPAAIAAKNKIVKQDPYENKGRRLWLNLGHTMGHVWEISLHLSHGNAVGLGILFALHWSWHRGLMSHTEFTRILRTPAFNLLVKELRFYALTSMQDLTDKKIEALLLSDKKKSAGKKINFIFLKKAGQPRIIPVTVSEVLGEYDFQWRS